MKKLINTVVLLFAITTLVNAQWSLTGNAGTDPSTDFIGTTDNIAFKIRTKSTVRMTVTGAGKIGIGTTNPYAQLVVSTNNTAVTRGIWSGQFTDLNLAATFGGRRARGTEAVPVAVAASDFTMGVVAQNFDGANFISNGSIGFRVTGAVTPGNIPGEWFFGATNNDDVNPYASNTVRMVVQSTGNVGIGTITPANKLSVAGNANFTGKVAIGTTTLPFAKFDVTDHSVNNIANFDSDDSLYISLNENGAYRGYLGSYSGAAADVDFGTGTGNTTGAVNFTIQAVPKMSIVSSGRVGIGTTAPQAKLQISHNSTINIPQLLLYESESDFARLSFKNSASSSYWSIAGLNSTTNADEQLNFWNSTTGDVMSLKGNGNVCIGTGTPATGYKLSVNGKIICEEMKVQLNTSWPDYVFSKNYNLRPLSEIEQYSNKNGHLPGVPSAQEIKNSGGVEVGQMQSVLLEKIEELTLHLIKQEKEIELLKSKLNEVSNLKK